MSTAADLASLLATGEQAAFHGKPSAAVDALEQAVDLAESQGLAAEASAATWLLGVALGAGGQYGRALAVLAPLLEVGPEAPAEHRLFAAFAGSTMASAQRQLGRHAAARALDLGALATTDGTGEAAYDAQLGLASDAIGLDESDEAEVRLLAAEAALPGQGDEWWRQRVRLDWARAELAMLVGDPERAVKLAQQAVKRAEDARAPRHVAKGLLLLGLAQVGAGDDVAVGTLRRAATFAESLGALPIVWPSRALLGALLAEDDQQSARQESARSLEAARAAVLAISRDLPGELQADWLLRPDISALLG